MTNQQTNPMGAMRALGRFRVLDLTRVRSGPTCVRVLADRKSTRLNSSH